MVEEGMLELLCLPLPVFALINRAQLFKTNANNYN